MVELPQTHTRTRLLAALPFLCLLVGSAAYAVIFGYLTILRFESFNSSIDDLGFYNELMWITIHGGPNAWTSYAQSNFYATYPWQTASFLLLVPAYAAFPSPATLLVAQAIGIPLATIPIYFLGRKYGFSGWACAGLGGCYLLNFQLNTANLLDFHLQSLYPLTFFSMVLFYEYGWKKLFLVVSLISLITNPLTLVLTFCFLAAVLVRECSPGPTFGRLTSRLVGWIRARNVESLVLVFGVVLAVFEVWTGSIAGYHVGASSAGSGYQGYLSSVPDRLLILFVSFAPLLAVAFLVRETVILVIPLVAFLAVANMGYFTPIGRQDSIEFLVVALWGLMLFASQRTGADRLTKVGRAIRARSSRLFRKRKARLPNLTIVTAVAVTAAFFVVLSPVSPWNQFPQLANDLNERPSDIVDITPADHFLTTAIALIPSDASVLTQNNIPQLTGRDTVQWAMPGKPPPNISQADYILSDQSSNSFARDWYTYLQPYVEVALTSKEFGVSAIGYGILLLQRGYHGAPELVGPLPYNPSELGLSSGYLAGSIAVHPAENNSDFWYGPYVDLPAGNYTVTYRLMIGPGASASAPILTVRVSNGTAASPMIYASSKLVGGDFPAPDIWVNVPLHFTLESFVTSMEFPGVWTTSGVVIYLSEVTITVVSLASA